MQCYFDIHFFYTYKVLSKNSEIFRFVNFNVSSIGRTNEKLFLKMLQISLQYFFQTGNKTLVDLGFHF